MLMKIRKGDTVVVIAGRDKGKKSEVIRVDRKAEKAVVKGINLVKKAVRRSQDHPNGGFVEVETFIHASNLMLFCPKCNKGVRVKVVVDKDGSKYRACKKCGYKFEETRS
jgi:large subunit ribosomal protein L24